jgi:hypothetical protein
MSEINLDESMNEIYDQINEEEAPEELVAEEPEKEPEEPEKEEPEPEAAEAEPEAEPDAEPEYRPAPPTWRAKAKAKWDTIDPEIRDEILKREEDGLKGVNQLKEKAGYGERLSSTIQPYQAFLNAKRVDAESVVKDALDLAYRLETSDPKTKAALLMNIAQQYGADMQVFKGDIPKTDPILQELQNLKLQIHQSQMTAQQAEQAKVNLAIQEFAGETENGKPRYPFFANVEEEMVTIIPLIKKREPNLTYKDVLVKAYDEAVWTNPETRQILIANKAKEETAKRQERQKDIVSRAEKAQKVNLKPKARDTSDKAKPLGTIDQTLNELYDELNAA